MAKGMLRPLGSKVLIERLEAESKTSGGIVLPDAAKEKPQRGKIRATGPGRVLDSGEISKMQVKTGDEVVFTSYAGTEVQVDRTKFMIMEESDILAVVE